MNTLKDISERLRKVELLVMDVDGTLTDSAMYYSAKGEELKRFSTRDGMGISLLHLHGIKTAIITSENTAIVSARAEKLKIERVILGSKEKLTDLQIIADEMKLSSENIAYIGDDINDLDVIKWAGVGACPSDAVQEVIEAADYVCNKPGGNGAVRELADMILKEKRSLNNY
jgi:YrbI family 3-deoxy-D-manno-octulosonate 8-phosphate phosphatase